MVSSTCEMLLSDAHRNAANKVAQDLTDLNTYELDAFSGVVADYQALYSIARERQVRLIQLDKEARELREESATLSTEVEALRVLRVHTGKAEEAEAELKQVRAELSDTYKTKSALTDEHLKATLQLQLVRDSHERSSRELAVSAAKTNELRNQNTELQKVVDELRQSYALIDSEMEVRLSDKEAAEAKADKLQADNLELTKRLVEMKTSEVDRINEANEMYNGMVKHARQLEKTAATQAAATGTRLALVAGASARGFMNMVQSGARRTSREATQHAALPEQPIVSAMVAKVPTRLARTMAGHGVDKAFACAWERSGGRLATAGADKTVRLWDSEGHHLNVLHGMLEGVYDCSWTCDGSRVLGAGNDNSIRIWDPASGRVLHTMTGHSGKVLAVEGSPMEVDRCVSSSVDRSLKTWDLARGVNLTTLMCASTCPTLALTLDANLIASGHYDGSMRLWDCRCGRLAHEVASLHPRAQICGLSMGGLGGLVLTCGKDNKLRVVDLRTLQPLATLHAPEFAVRGVWAGCTLGPDERHAAAGSHDGTVFIWELGSNTVVKTLTGAGNTPVLDCSWNPQGCPLASCDSSGAVSWWEGPDTDSTAGDYPERRAGADTSKNATRRRFTTA